MFIGKRSGEMNTRTTIMTVDDSASMRQMISFTLKGAGYEVVEAVDGRDAIEKMESYPVQMLITDINMPNLDGIELVRKVRMHAVYRFIPIILLTTESQDTKRREGKAAGATGWIVKPFKPDQLINVVRKVIG
jgi:two-component system, chemotaxis family, chemotaxis protein CheY